MSDSMLLRGRWVITGGGPNDSVHTDAAILVEGEAIAEIGPWAALRARHPQGMVLGSDKTALLPGLINAHHHTTGASYLQHGVPDALLELWIRDLGRCRPSDIHLDTLLGSARLLRTGVTSVVDVHSGGGTAEVFAARMGRALAAYEQAGMRVAFAAGVSSQSLLVHGADADADERFIAALPAELRDGAREELPAPGSISTEQYFAVIGEFLQRYRDHPRIDIWYGPPGPQWVPDAVLQRIAAEAERHDTGIQTHVAESLYEKLHGPRCHGRPIVQHLRELGVLGPRLSLAHGVWLSQAEIEVLAETGTALSHNPSSNLRLRAGIAPLNAMLAAGVTVAIGMDATTLDDDEDMFTEMRLAMRLHRTPRLRMPAPSPAAILDLATAGGARLLRKEARLGKLAPGHAADIVVVDLERIAWPWVAPEADPRELVLMRAKAGDVRTVMIGGKVVLRDGRPTGFDLEAAGRELAAQLAAASSPLADASLEERLRAEVEAHYAAWDVPELSPYTAYNSSR